MLLLERRCSYRLAATALAEVTLGTDVLAS